VYSGRPEVCVECHDDRRAADWIYAFDLPR
jgi:hypothetical protein